MKQPKLNGEIQYPDNDLQAKYDKLKEDRDRLKKVLEGAAFDLRIRKQMKENMTPMQLLILKNAEQALNQTS